MTFTGPARAKAFAAVGTTGGLGLALGPTFSGWMVDGLGWRATFLAFAGVGVVILLGSTLLAESKAAVRPRVDKAGAVTFIGGLALVLFAVTQGSKQGWASAPTLLPLAAGAALFVTFVRIEKRILQRAALGEDVKPVLDLTLIRNRAFVAWPIGLFGMGAGVTAALVFLPTYLQATSGFTAREAGLTLLYISGPLLVLPQVGARLVARGIAAQHLLVLSQTLIAAGNIWLGAALHPGITLAEPAAPVLPSASAPACRRGSSTPRPSAWSRPSGPGWPRGRTRPGSSPRRCGPGCGRWQR